MKKVTFAILAHVDAGKTTLSEAMLFHAGVIKKMGRVDKEDSFLDYDIQERKRGITDGYYLTRSSIRLRRLGTIY
mgnify:FL=1